MRRDHTGDRVVCDRALIGRLWLLKGFCHLIEVLGAGGEDHRPSHICGVFPGLDVGYLLLYSIATGGCKAGKGEVLSWLSRLPPPTIKHCTAGIGIWEWASNDQGGEPEVVLACCGDVPTLETLAAVDLFRQYVPELKIRIINVVDLMTLQPPSKHPHGLSDKDFDVLFTANKPIIFAFHGYPWLIHRLTYRRTNHHRRAGSARTIPGHRGSPRAPLEHGRPLSGHPTRV
jgi:XFP C-terminal domain